MNIFTNRYRSNHFNAQAFTILELLFVIAIISILTSISVPSFSSYIHLLRLKTFRAVAISDINYMVTASQKYGSNCNIQFNQLRTTSQMSDRFAASLNCYQDSQQLRISNASSKFIPLETDDIFILSNSPSLQIGNHGAIVGAQDYVYIIGYKPSFGAETSPLCITLTRYNSSIKFGKYSRNVSSLSGAFIVQTGSCACASVLVNKPMLMITKTLSMPRILHWSILL